MSMIGVLRQLDESQLAHLLKNPDDVLDFTEEQVPASQELNLDKAWHGLHFLLTGEAWGGAEPVCYLVAGGEQIGDEEDHDVGYGPASGIHAHQVRAFAEALSATTEQELLSRYDGQKMMALELYPRGWEEEPDEMRAWMAVSFNRLKEFVKQTARKGKALVVWIQ